MKKLVCILYLVLYSSCSDNMERGSIIGAQDPPVGVQLVFPAKDDLCNEGINFTLTESTVFFEWESNDNAISYDLTLENLITGSIQQFSTEEEILPITIARATAFRWYVNYNLSGEIKKSEVWNFYNAGPGIETFPPFPADLLFPEMAESLSPVNSITLQWSGSDLDNDIIDYDLYFGLNNPPDLLSSDLTVDVLTVSVSPGNSYYWKVVTKDALGNTSESNTFQFRVLD
ncbi:MAG: hypothetical protein AAGH46_12155 [Bacteroidota bacterium]